MCSKKGLHDFDSPEAFFEGGRHELRGHQIQRVAGYDARSLEIASFADVEGDIEVDGVDIAIACAGEFDERAAVAAGQVGCINVCHRPLQLDAMTQQHSHGGKDRSVYGLVGFIVRQLQADRIA